MGHTHTHERVPRAAYVPRPSRPGTKLPKWSVPAAGVGAAAFGLAWVLAPAHRVPAPANAESHQVIAAPTLAAPVQAPVAAAVAVTQATAIQSVAAPARRPSNAKAARPSPNPRGPRPTSSRTGTGPAASRSRATA
ncbi:MAG: hypothetical protein M0D55_15385 [Elusimicrobiota bacterium]|nr:MAG: hypothetical protein M0D55_15385 [Elusimicrobiota bacterium]